MRHLIDSIKFFPSIWIWLAYYKKIIPIQTSATSYFYPTCTSQLRISGVTSAPYYNLEDPALISNWNTRRHASGLWADFKGRHFRVTVPSAVIRDLPDPGELMEIFDSMVRRSCYPLKCAYNQKIKR